LDNKLVTSQDGTANTYLFGETLGGRAIGTRDFEASWWAGGGLPTGWGLRGDAQWYSFGSKHSSGVTFAMADGAVKMVARRISFNAYTFTAGWRDGQYVGEVD
jgi:prepilin-type processing-associated H-X9-DG protein